MVFKYKFVLVVVVFIFVASSTVTGKDYEDYEEEMLQPSAKGQAPPPPPPPPPPAPKPAPPSKNLDPASGSTKLKICSVDTKSFVVTLLEDSKLADDKLAIYVKPTCTNVPRFATSVNWMWDETVSDVRVPPQKCFRAFESRDCCGEFIDITSNGPRIHEDDDWNDNVKSFATCDYNGGCPGNGGDVSTLAIFYEAYNLKGCDNLALKIEECCTNIPATQTTKNAVWDSAISGVKLPPGKYIRVFDKPNCDGNHLDVPEGAKADFIFASGFDDKIKSFMPISKEMVETPSQNQMATSAPTTPPPPATTPPPPPPTPAPAPPPVIESKCPLDTKSFVTIFLEDSKLKNDKLAMYVKPRCTNVPKFKTSINWDWDSTVSDVRVPQQKCIRLFDKGDCCGRSLDIRSNGPTLWKQANWNDRVKSFATCDYNGGCPSSGGDDSSLAIFYEGYGLKGFDTLALEIQDCCTNIPAARTTRNGQWDNEISEIKVPPGKYIRVFDQPNCEGRYLDVVHGARANLVYSTGFNDRIKSFRALSEEMVVTVCQDQTKKLPWYASSVASVTGDQFPATAYGALRNWKAREHGIYQLNVKPTCTVTPIPGISDVVVANNNCVCLFDRSDCTGAEFTISSNNDPNFIIREGFNDRAQSYRACSHHIVVKYVNATR